MDLLTADVETYFGDDYTLTNMTNEAYIRGPLFEVNIWGFKINDTPAFWLLPDRAHQFITQEVDWANTTLLCHHGQFDAAILNWKYGVSPAFIMDTIPMSRIVDGPKVKHDLEACITRHQLGLKHKEVLVRARGKRLADFDRTELHWYGEYCKEDCENTYKLAQFYLPQITELQLRLIDLKTRMFTEPVFEGDIPLLEQAVKAEIERKQAILNGLGLSKESFTSKGKFAAILKQIGCEVPMKPSPKHPEKLIPAFAKTDPGFQALLEDDDEIVRALADARLECTSNIIQTRAQRFYDAAKRGPLPVYIKANGTHTQRASAGDSMNWMNMTSVNKLRPEMTVLKRSIRAPEGCLIVSADSSQIQARLTAWLAGQQDKVQAFAQGRDVYSEFATLIYRRPVDRKKNPVDDFIPGQVGKITELSSMFQKGWYSMAFDFLKGHLGAPPIQFKEADMRAMNVNPDPFLNSPRKIAQVEQMPSRLGLSDRLIHCIVSEAIVKEWRAANPMVSDKRTGLWAMMERAINAMIRGEEFRFGPNGFLYTEKETIVAPSGARLHYSGLERNGDGEASYWDGRARVHLYGGSATNNVIQLLEQEIMGAALLAIADKGYKVATEAYDNAVCVVPAEYAQVCLSDMLAILHQPPAWGQDIPLAAEGGFGKTWYDCK